MLSYILAILCGIFVLGADVVSKLYIIRNFALGETAPFIKGLIDIVYIHNRGAAWGIFGGKTLFLILFTIAIMVFCIVFLVKNAKKSKLMFWAVILIISGGIGNMYDRIFREGNVVDFLHFEFWPDFPVFNIADCAVVVGGGLLVLYFVIDIFKDYKLKKQVNDADI